jgi:hypothetical protein
VVEKMFSQTGRRIDVKQRMQAKRMIRIDNPEIKRKHLIPTTVDK